MNEWIRARVNRWANQGTSERIVARVNKRANKSVGQSANQSELEIKSESVEMNKLELKGQKEEDSGRQEKEETYGWERTTLSGRYSHLLRQTNSCTQISVRLKKEGSVFLIFGFA